MRANRFNVGLLSAALAVGIAGCDSQSSEPQQQSMAPQATPVEVITMAKKPTTMYSELPARVVATRVS
ncbi:MAG: hypothetical protein ACTH6E_02810, partial [Vibrio litoralis]